MTAHWEYSIFIVVLAALVLFGLFKFTRILADTMIDLWIRSRQWKVARPRFNVDLRR